MSPSVSIVRYRDHALDPRIETGLDDVFFQSSATQTFSDVYERSRFRERWLGRYLNSFPELAFLALIDNVVAGYIVGADVNPAASVFSDIGYFADFVELTTRFPAHLHVNVADGHRNRGIGAGLLYAFLEELRSRGAIGVHAITALASPNVRFYTRNGFAELGRLTYAGRELVFLARPL